MHQRFVAGARCGPLDGAVGDQLFDLRRRQAQQVAQDVIIVLRQDGRRTDRLERVTPKIPRRGQHGQFAQMRLLNLSEGVLRAQMRIMLEVGKIERRHGRDARGLQECHRVVLFQGRGPGADGGIDQCLVGTARLRAGSLRRIGQIRTPDHLTQGMPLRIGTNSNADPLVVARARITIMRRPVRVVVADAFLIAQPGRRTQHRVTHQGGGDFLTGEVNPAPLAGLRALPQRGEYAERGEGTTGQVDRHAHAARHAVGVTAQVGKPAHRREDAGIRRPGTVAATPGNGTQDDVRLDATQVFVAEPEAREGARGHVFDDDVALFDDLANQVEGLGILEVEADCEFAHIHFGKLRTGVKVDGTVVPAMAACVLAKLVGTAARFDLDDLCAQKRQQLRAVWPGAGP